MSDPTVKEIAVLVAQHYGVSNNKAFELMRSPLYPRKLRDEFAMFAMRDVMQEWRINREDGEGTIESDAGLMAEDCYLMADAMIKARCK